MPFLVEHLLEDRGRPITAHADESVSDVVARMVEHSFSQLPVVDADGRPIAMVSSDSIVRGLNNFRAAPDVLRVHDVMVELDDKRKFRADEDLFLLLDDLRDTYAVVIVDRDGRLIGIVTPYDTTEYFRQRAEDLMLAREIEKLIKDYILEAFRQSTDGEVDPNALAAAIFDITPSNNKLRGPFTKALQSYLSQLNGATSIKMDAKLCAAAFEEHLYEKPVPRPFDDLSLNDYIELLLHQSRWKSYHDVFRVDSAHLRSLLTAVRDTRNDLAHLREEISAHQRDELRFCRHWLARHEQALLHSFGEARMITSATSGGDGAYESEVGDGRSDLVTPLDEIVSPKDSRYTPLALFLQQQPLDTNHIDLTFGEIETIIGDTLPESARVQRQFWANDSVGHIQSQQWLEAGWRVSSLNLTAARVKFIRIEGRQRAYIKFFSSLIADLEAATFPLLETSPTGRYWQGLVRLPVGEPAIGTLGFAFTIQRRARVEFYLDTGEQTRNKALFDALYARREFIETSSGVMLDWERMSEKRASRIAVYRRGAIGDQDADLVVLRSWAVDHLTKLFPLLNDATSVVVSDLSKQSETT